MTCYCKLCDKKINLKTKNEHLTSRDRKHSEGSSNMKYIVENPDISRLLEILKNYICIHNEKYAVFQVRCVLKVNDNQHHRRRPAFNLDFRRNPKINIKNRLHSSQLRETRITFNSSFEMMTHRYYLKQPEPMCEIKLSHLLDKNHEFIDSLNRYYIPLIMKEYAYVLPNITVDGNVII